MAYDILQSSTGTPLLFFMVQSADHIAGLTGASPTVTISKNGGAFASPSGAVSEIANGWYKVAGNATDTGTLGPIALHATAASGDAFDNVVAQVVAYNPQDAVHLGLSALPNTACTTNASLLTSGTGTDQLSVTSGRIDVGKALGTAVTLDANNVLNVSAKYLAGTALTGRDIGASVLLSTGTGTGQLDFTSGVVKSNGVQWLGAAVAAVNVTGVPLVDLKYTLGTISPAAAGSVAIDWGQVSNKTSTVALTGTTIGTLTTYTGNTPQTGDAYARIGAPVGASISADIAAVKTDVDAIPTTHPGIRKNTALAGFEFLMTDSTSHNPVTGKTVAVTRSIDKGAFAAGTLSAVTEVSNGIYAVDFGAGDLNGNVVTLRATATGADDAFITIVTNP